MLEQSFPNTQTLGILTAAAQDEIVKTIVDVLAGRSKGVAAQGSAVFAELDRVLKQRDQRLDERLHRLPRKFFPQLGQFAQQVNQTTLLGAVETVVGGVEIADQGAGERFTQRANENVVAAMAVNEEQGQR